MPTVAIGCRPTMSDSFFRYQSAIAIGVSYMRRSSWYALT